MRKSREIAIDIIKHITGQDTSEDDIMYVGSLLENYAQDSINKWANQKNAEDFKGVNVKEHLPRNTQQLELNINGRSVSLERVQVWSR